jgi:hypothetical protein
VVYLLADDTVLIAGNVVVAALDDVAKLGPRRREGSDPAGVNETVNKTPQNLDRRLRLNSSGRTVAAGQESFGRTVGTCCDAPSPLHTEVLVVAGRAGGIWETIL